MEPDWFNGNNRMLQGDSFLAHFTSERLLSAISHMTFNKQNMEENIAFKQQNKHSCFSVLIKQITNTEGTVMPTVYDTTNVSRKIFRGGGTIHQCLNKHIFVPKAL